MLRTLVPVLGALSLCAAAPAQEIAKGLFMDGWVDTVFSVVDTPNYVPANTNFSQADVATDFYAKANLKLGYNVTNRVKTKINVWFHNDPSVKGASNVELREAFAAVDLGNNLSWTMGKFISHMGWISADPTGLYRINGSTIGLYDLNRITKNDPIGTGLGWTDSSGTFGGTVYAVNGYFRGKDGEVTASIDDGTIQPKNDVGLGADLTFSFGADKASNVNLDFAMDGHSSNPTTVPGVSRKPGYVYLVGLNTTIKPTGKESPLTLGGEVTATTAQYEDTDETMTKHEDRQDLCAMLMANYVLPGDGKWPMSVTGMYQRTEPYFMSKGPSSFTSLGTDPKDGKPYYRNNRVATNEVSLALLTNPFGDSKFGLNFEVAHAFVDGGADNPAVYPVSADDPRHGVTIVSMEALVAIP